MLQECIINSMSSPEKIAVVVPAYNEPGIGRTLQGLYSQNQRRERTHHFIIDNGSIDTTRAHIEAFMDDHDDFPLTVLEEAQKGTGAAVDTGFRAAIERGYHVIARTDADTVPSPSWTTTISNDFDTLGHVQLLGGKSSPLRDEHYRIGDTLLLPLAVKAARIVLALKNGDPRYLKAVVGHNMATRADTYEVTGGFERSSIDKMDEDIDFSLKVAARYGAASIRIDSNLEVETSMRRIRGYGIAGTALHHLFPEFRAKRKGGVDVR